MTTVRASFVRDLADFLKSGPRLYEFEAFLGNPFLVQLAELVAKGVVSERDLRTLRIHDVKRVRSNLRALRIVSDAFEMIAEESLTPEEVHGFVKSPALRRIARSSKSKGAPTSTELRAFFAKWPAWELTPAQEEMRRLLREHFVTPAEAVRHLHLYDLLTIQAPCPEALATFPEEHSTHFAAPYRGFKGRSGLFFPLLGERRPHNVFERFFLKGRSPHIHSSLWSERVLRDLPVSSPRWRAAILHPDLISRTSEEQHAKAEKMGGKIASLEETLTYLVLWHSRHEELPSYRMNLRVADHFIRRNTCYDIAVTVLNHREIEIVELGPNEKSDAVSALLVF